MTVHEPSDSLICWYGKSKNSMTIGGGTRGRAGPSARDTLQGVYFRRNPHHPWELLRATKSVGDAEGLARLKAKSERRGRLLYVEAKELPLSIWDMRTLRHRKLGGWLAKSLLSEFSKVRQSGRVRWTKIDRRQMVLF